MPILKIGDKYYNGKQSAVYLITGNVVRDAERCTTQSGKDYCKTSIAARENKDGTTDFITLYGWRSHMSEVSCLHKGASVLAVGSISINDYNGKKYYNCDVDFVAASGAGCFGGTSGGNIEAVAKKFDELNESEEDGELPF